jgi:hypothetical protein
LYEASVFDSTENDSLGAQSLIARQSHQLENFVVELFVFQMATYLGVCGTDIIAPFWMQE